MATDTSQAIINVIGAIVSSDTPITNETALDSLSLTEYDRLEMIMRLEDQFKVCIDDEQFKECKKVKDLTNYLHSHF